MKIIIIVIMIQSIGKRGPLSDQDRAVHLAHLGRPIFFGGGKIAMQVWGGGASFHSKFCSSWCSRQAVGGGEGANLQILQST